MPEKKSCRQSGVFTAGVLLLVAAVFLCIEITGVKAQLADKRLKVSAFLFAQTVSVSDIQTLELRTELDFGRRTFGVGGLGVLSGNFNNGAFGAYRCACYKKVQSYIVTRLTTGQTLVFNLSTAEKTEAFYETLRQATGIAG